MEKMYKDIVEGALEAILFADRHGKIRLWNRGAEKMFGYQKKEAIGQSLDLIIPEKFRRRHWDGYFNVMETGETRFDADLMTVPAARRDGKPISLEFSINMIRDAQHHVLGIAAVIRDVTERWKKETSKKDSIRDASVR